jgi:hypothetical protein
MHTFPIHTLDSAPAQSKPSLEALQGVFGAIPNIAGAMSTSPVLIGGLVALFQKVHGGSFSEQQIQVLLLTNAVTNASTWAVAFHTALAWMPPTSRQSGTRKLRGTPRAWPYPRWHAL